MTTITINECIYYVHPFYDLYAGSKDGNVINIIKQAPNKGNKKHNGYFKVNVRKHAQPGQKSYEVHCFIWECLNGLIPEGKVIDHINNDKEDNRLSNLQLLTQQHTTINECVYNVHPIYDLYAGSEVGNIIHIIKKVTNKGNNQHNSYLNICVRKHGQSGVKGFQVHRFIWECFNGLIPEGKVIDHINNDKEDNRLCNLQLLTSQQNNKKISKGSRLYICRQKS